MKHPLKQEKTTNIWTPPMVPANISFHDLTNSVDLSGGPSSEII